MPFAMPPFAILTRRYFGTLLVNSSNIKQNSAYIDNKSQLVVLFSKKANTNSTIIRNICDNRTNVYKCHRKHPHYRYRKVIHNLQSNLI